MEEKTKEITLPLEENVTMEVAGDMFDRQLELLQELDSAEDILVVARLTFISLLLASRPEGMTAREFAYALIDDVFDRIEGEPTLQEWGV